MNNNKKCRSELLAYYQQVGPCCSRSLQLNMITEEHEIMMMVVGMIVMLLRLHPSYDAMRIYLHLGWDSWCLRSGESGAGGGRSEVSCRNQLPLPRQLLSPSNWGRDLYWISNHYDTSPRLDSCDNTRDTQSITSIFTHFLVT